MQKKLLAVAVAGALGAPALALAQNATVNVYGRMYIEYGLVNQGNRSDLNPAVAGQSSLATVDILQSPGSNIGFRGEEKLGGGMSAWFQCETTAEFRGAATAGLCSRNSALGLKGAFGNVFVGNWDTPFKRVTETVGGNETGVFGTAYVLFGNSATFASGNAGPGVYKRRQNNMITYDSPNFSGFSASAAYTATNTATPSFSGTSSNKPRIWSLNASYKNGPLNVFGAYEKHKEFRGATAPFGLSPTISANTSATLPATAGTASTAAPLSANREGDETGWALGASYTFKNNLKLGGLYTRQTSEGGTTALPTESRVNAWHLGIDWNISGPHGVRAAYSRVGDVSGAGAAALGAATGTSTALVPNVTRPAFNAAGATSAKLWQIRYVHALSKRTEMNVGYVRLDNGANASYQLGGVSSNVNGSDQSAWALSLDHRF